MHTFASMKKSRRSMLDIAIRYCDNGILTRGVFVEGTSHGQSCNEERIILYCSSMKTCASERELDLCCMCSSKEDLFRAGMRTYNDAVWLPLSSIFYYRLIVL